MSRKSAAAGLRCAMRSMTSSLYTMPSGLEYLGTHHIPFTAGSFITSSTMSMSGPSSFMGTVISSMPKAWVTLKWRS